MQSACKSSMIFLEATVFKISLLGPDVSQLKSSMEGELILESTLVYSSPKSATRHTLKNLFVVLQKLLGIQKSKDMNAHYID